MEKARHNRESRKLARVVTKMQSQQIYHRKRWLDLDVKINSFRASIAIIDGGIKQ